MKAVNIPVVFYGLHKRSHYLPPPQPKDVCVDKTVNSILAINILPIVVGVATWSFFRQYQLRRPFPLLCCKISSNGQYLNPIDVNGSRVNNCLRKTTPVNGTCFIDNILSHLNPIPNLATAIVLIELIQLVKMPHVLMSNYASAYQVCFKK